MGKSRISHNNPPNTKYMVAPERLSGNRIEKKPINISELIRFQTATAQLEIVVNNGIPIEINEQTLYKDQFEALLVGLQRWSSRVISNRLQKYQKKFPQSDPVERLFAAQMINLGLFKKARAMPATRGLLEKLPDAAKTPAGYIPEPAQKNEILSWDKLESVAELLKDSADIPGSVAQQLLDPLNLSLNGLRVKVITQEETNEARNWGFTIPVALLDILKTLRYKESEKELKEWILVRCSSSEPEALNAIQFLYTLINFASFLDSQDHLELWKPKTHVSEHWNDILLQPFQSLLNSVSNARYWLEKSDPQGSMSEVLANIETLIRLRYGEVYKRDFRTSLYTANIEAITPSAQDFADLMEVFARRTFGQDRFETATAIVRLVESCGIKDINPLITSLGFNSQLQEGFIDEARRSGLLPDSKAEFRARDELRYEPFKDIPDVDFSRIIDQDTTHIEIYLLTGTYGPPTMGHIDMIEKLVRSINTLPKDDEYGKYHRLVVILPIPNTENIPNYSKNPSEVGPLKERVKALMLQLSGPSIDRRQVFITTATQVDPASTRSIETRFAGTYNQITTKICKDLEKFDLRFSSHLVTGADEIEKVGDPPVIAPRSLQKRKITDKGGVVVGRWGHELALIAGHIALGTQTGTEYVILRQDNPNYSSTIAKKQIAKGDASMIRAPARRLVLNTWSSEAVNKRSAVQPTENISVTEICKELIQSG